MKSSTPFTAKQGRLCAAGIVVASAAVLNVPMAMASALDAATIATKIPETITLMVVFLAFFWVLKKFAWGPVLDIMDERQKKIEDGFDEIDNLQKDAADAHKKYEEKLRDIEAEARDKMQEALAEGQRIAQEIAEEARADAVATKEKAKQDIEIELQNAKKKIREEIIDLTLQATEKLIAERLTDEKDRELIGSFIGEIENKNS